MKWNTWATVAGGVVKSALPFQGRLRALKRKWIGYEPDSSHHEGAVADGIRQIRLLRKHLGSVEGLTALEIGTGWEPIIPLIYHLAGFRTVFLTDLEALLSADSIAAAIHAVQRFSTTIGEELSIPRHRIDRVTAGGDGRAFLESLGLRYLAPCDCRSLALPNGSVDVVYSRAVLEHIPPPILEGILAESRRLIKPEGVACHFIDTSDHFQHRDRSLSRINFLRYSESAWKWISLARTHYQNRLRHSDYVRSLENNGFRLTSVESIIDERAASSIHELQIAAHLRGRPADDLTSIGSRILAVPA